MNSSREDIGIMAKFRSSAPNDVREQVGTLAQTFIEQAAHRAVFGTDKAKGAATAAKDKMSNRHRVTEDIAPSIRDVALQAASAAIELWQATRERAEVLVDGAESAIGEPAAGVVDFVDRRARSAASQVADRAEDVSGRARHAAAHVAERAEEASDRARHAVSNAAERAEEVTDRARNAASNVAGSAGEASERARSAATHAAHVADDVSVRAKEATRSAAETTVATSKDTGAALLWTAAAAGIVFYALLDKGRREQVLKVVDEVIAQAREIVRDFQGDDEEFV